MSISSGLAKTVQALAPKLTEAQAQHALAPMLQAVWPTR
jgi:hypothetical protein